jgi:hypothetical protein
MNKIFKEKSRSPSNDYPFSYKEYQDKLKSDNKMYENKLKSLKDKIVSL